MNIQDQAAIVLSLRQAKNKGITLGDYANEYEYSNILDALKITTLAENLAYKFKHFSDSELLEISIT